MSPTHVRPTYQTFLVMVWQEPHGPDEFAASWRFRLEDPRTQQKRLFANAQALIVALKEATLVSEPLA